MMIRCQFPKDGSLSQLVDLLKKWSQVMVQVRPEVGSKMSIRFPRPVAVTTWRGIWSKWQSLRGSFNVPPPV